MSGLAKWTHAKYRVVLEFEFYPPEDDEEYCDAFDSYEDEIKGILAYLDDGFANANIWTGEVRLVELKKIE